MNLKVSGAKLRVDCPGMLGTQRPTSRNVFAEASETASYSKRIIAPETRARNPGTPATSARCFEQAMLPRHIAEGIAHQLKEFRIGADDWAAQIDFEDGQMVNEDCKLSLEKGEDRTAVAKT